MLVTSRYDNGYTMQHTENAPSGYPVEWTIFVERWSDGWHWELHQNGMDASDNRHGVCQREDGVGPAVVRVIADIHRNGGYPGYTLSRFDGKCGCGKVTDHSLGYSELWDSFFCKNCLVWLDEDCGDDERPEKPSKPLTPKELHAWRQHIMNIMRRGELRD